MQANPLSADGDRSRRRGHRRQLSGLGRAGGGGSDGERDGGGGGGAATGAQSSPTWNLWWSGGGKFLSWEAERGSVIPLGFFKISRFAVVRRFNFEPSDGRQGAEGSGLRFGFSSGLLLDGEARPGPRGGV